MNALTLPAERRRTQDVTLTGLLTPTRSAITAAMRAAAGWLRCNLATLNILRAIFGARLSATIVTVSVLLVWFHNFTIDNPDALAEAVGRDIARALPWMSVWAIRACRWTGEEGGES